jgi:hypothetical protein
VATEQAKMHKSTDFLTEENRTFSPIEVLWNNNFNPTITGQRIVFNSCTFSVDANTVESADNVYVVRTTWNDVSQDNKVILNCATVDDAFDGTFHSECVQCEVNETQCLTTRPHDAFRSGGAPARTMRPPLSTVVLTLHGRLVLRVNGTVDARLLRSRLPVGAYMLATKRGPTATARPIFVQ